MASCSPAPSALLVVALLCLTDSLSTTGASDDADSGPPGTATVRTAVGETAFLRCHLPPARKHVSWARQQTANVTLKHKRRIPVQFGRNQAYCSRDNDVCLLIIRNVEKSDSGLYLCSKPPVQRGVYLSVFEPIATILGEPLRAHWQGSAVNLTCVIQPRPGPGDTVVWMHGDTVINPFLDSRLSITTETDASTVSHLLLQDAQPKDSGRYTCRLTSGSSDSVDVDVMQVVRDDFSPTMSGVQQPPTALPASVLAVVASAVTASASHWC